MARPSVPCPYCGQEHRKAFHHRRARECLIGEADRIRAVARKWSLLMAKGHSPSDMTIQAMLLEVERFAALAGDHIRATDLFLPSLAKARHECRKVRKAG